MALPTFLLALSGIAKGAHSLSFDRSSCKCVPQDSCWPLTQEWQSLNQTVEGRLIVTVPLASVCHQPHLAQSQCEKLKDGWPFTQTHIPDPASFVSPLAQNGSCDPYSPQTSKCDIGNYPVYVVNASTPEHVAAALRFAKKKNIRVVVKSTGHDLLGKSSGHGSLGIWMHSFNHLSFTPKYTGVNSNYIGPAARIGPGVLSYELYEKAAKNGLRVLGGTCPTVAVAGGYTAGGGHSLLSGKYGLSADNVLEWEVVTSNGSHITATPTHNADLYWALSGGGGGVFAVTLSMTVKAFPDGPIATAGLTFEVSTSPNEDVFWSAVQAFHKQIPVFVDYGASAPYVIQGGIFSLQPLTLPDKSDEEVEDLIAPLLAELNALKVPYKLNVTTFPSFYDMFAAYYGPLPYGVVSHSEVQASRLIPRPTLLQKSDELIKVHRKIASLKEGPFWIVGNSFRVPRTPSAPNAVLPAWRDTDIHQMVVGPWNWTATWTENLAKEQALLDTVLPGLSQFSRSTYLNEGTPNQADWKEAFYGSNYGRLRKIKRVYDPDDVFYAKTGVGSDEWSADSDQRLCRI
ncbi:FAD-binding domain-containing protein [Lentithecium fluviatile CBS 122367]|uniref:FAD-binding domain-containing protein n=1 Tax=Lentithecium fluviatile CBS 122367 TaxID=1168545 RepID=A0A6G1INJ1_9PLEO|nr:FAD-binding domain-containing protein [Lentithecium fluviatile CBS 122367]